MLCYMVLLYFTIIRLFLKKVTKTAKIRTLSISILLLFLIISNLCVIGVGYKLSFWHQLVSFLVLMFFIRSLRESWKRIALVVYDSVTILMIIFSYIIYFSLLGFALFEAQSLYGDGHDYFPDIGLSIFNMYVLFTTSNFPDIIFPFYKVSNSTVFFFIGFLFFGLYLLLNLMLAVFYNSYRHQIEKKINKYDKLRAEFLEKEFAKLSKDD